MIYLALIVISGANRTVRNQIASMMVTKLSILGEYFVIHEMERTVSKRFRLLWQELHKDILTDDMGTMTLFRSALSSKEDDIWAQFATMDLNELFCSGNKDVILTGAKGRGEIEFFREQLKAYTILLADYTIPDSEDIPEAGAESIYNAIVKISSKEDLEDTVEKLVSAFLGAYDELMEAEVTGPDGEQYIPENIDKKRDKWDISDVQ